MDLFTSSLTKEVGLQLLLCPLGSKIIVRTACCSVGVASPVYSTFKAIERKDEDEQKKWLMYWAAYGTFGIAEVLADKFLTWFPMYYHLKFAFLVWLQLPSTDVGHISSTKAEIKCGEDTFFAFFLSGNDPNKPEG